MMLSANNRQSIDELAQLVLGRTDQQPQGLGKWITDNRDELVAALTDAVHQLDPTATIRYCDEDLFEYEVMCIGRIALAVCPSDTPPGKVTNLADTRRCFIVTSNGKRPVHLGHKL